MIGGDAIKPGAKRALALERAELGDDLDQHLLGDLLGVVRPEDHANRDIVNPRLVSQDQLFQRGAVAVLGLLHQLGIHRTALGDLVEGIEHQSSPCSNSKAIIDVGATFGHLDTVDMANVTGLDLLIGDRLARHFPALPPEVVTCM